MYRSLALSAVLALSLSCSPVRPQEGCLNIYPSRPVAEVSPLFWGTNFLFWVEDDEALADGKIENSLKELHCPVLRYPGGTVADNFHWSTNLLDNHHMFPYEEGGEQSDFDEFMSFCTRVGAEPLLVVNTQSWYLRGDIEGGAAEAAEWVRYCREKGYKARYWEIGNETYWHPVMTAREYGALAKKYAAAMKAVDPSIKISVNGGWSKDMTGDKERLEPGLADEVSATLATIGSKEEFKEFEAYVKSHTANPWTTGDDKWWDGVLTECGDQIDMLSVHWYYFDGKVAEIDRNIGELKAHVDSLRPGNGFLYCLSEFNCNTENGPRRMTGLAESLGRFLCSGIDIACIWPLRIGGAGYRGMLDLRSKEEQYPYQLFKLFSEKIKGRMLRCDDGGDVYCFAAAESRKKGMGIVLSGRQLKEARTMRVCPGISLDGRTVEATGWSYDDGSRRIHSRELEVNQDGAVIEVEVLPNEFTLIEIKK